MTNAAVVGKVLYLGKDNEFSGPLKNFFSAKSDKIVFVEKIYSKGMLVKECSSSIVDIIFVDFSEDALNVDSLISEILFLKRILQFKSVLFVAIFKNETQKNEHVHLFTSGFQLSYIKGTDTITVFIDSFYIGFRQKIDFPVLALARNINKDLQVGICSTLSIMNNSEFRVETDIEGIQNHLSLNLAMFPDLKCNSFEIKETHASSDLYPMTTSYTLSYPFPGPWGDDSEATIQPDTVDTWLDNNKHEFDSKLRIRVKVLSTDVSIVNEFFQKCGESIVIDFGDEFKNVGKESDSARPSLIFINLDDGDAGEINLPLLDNLISSTFLVSDYHPIIVVSNCPSNGEALQKVYNYPMIVATKPKLDSDLFLTLVSKYQIKKQGTALETVQSFNPSSTFRQMDVFQTFMITSLTEHEITFFSDVELPMFTVLHFTLPIEFHATVVPTIMELTKKANRVHYMAFIHGLSEEQLMTLRQFVNQIIYTPLVDFSPECILKMREAVPNVKESETPKVKVIALAASETKQPIEYKKYAFSGKSKL